MSAPSLAIPRARQQPVKKVVPGCLGIPLRGRDKRLNVFWRRWQAVKIKRRSSDQAAGIGSPPTDDACSMKPRLNQGIDHRRLPAAACRHVDALQKLPLLLS